MALYAATVVLLMGCSMVGTLLGRFINPNVPERVRKPLGSGSTLTALGTLAMVMTFSAVVLLIIDLDRPAQTMFNVDQQTMIDLQRSFSEPGP